MKKDSYRAFIRDWRKNVLGFTMEDLGMLLGVDKNTISRYESGIIKTIPRPIINLIENWLEKDAERGDKETRFYLIRFNRIKD